MTERAINSSKKKLLIGYGNKKLNVLENFIQSRKVTLPIDLISKDNLEIHFSSTK